MPSLISDWRRVLARSWSIRLMVVAGIFSALEAALPFLEHSFDWPDGVFAALSGVTVGVAFLARLLAQSTMEAKDHAGEE